MICLTLSDAEAAHIFLTLLEKQRKLENSNRREKDPVAINYLIQTAVLNQKILAKIQPFMVPEMGRQASRHDGRGAEGSPPYKERL